MGGAVNLMYALYRTLIRHTQQQRLGGATVCKLPEKTEEAIAGTLYSLNKYCPCYASASVSYPFLRQVARPSLILLHAE